MFECFLITFNNMIMFNEYHFITTKLDYFILFHILRAFVIEISQRKYKTKQKHQKSSFLNLVGVGVDPVDVVRDTGVHTWVFGFSTSDSP